ncbi:hypothetical protein E3P92_00268 [Wallemia ichthyophaga]|nr:hypothetical protein E3P92_00268 [Wallemia ichthyophaga]TIB37235.1 hypothetical protein E3P84_00430 [Wallemia ichthyophaga]TIB43844.1 hypothetical protein E3P83_00573 [Wallemia ichthyophaga]
MKKMKKVLLMGKSGAGKASMRSIIFNKHPSNIQASPSIASPSPSQSHAQSHSHPLELLNSLSLLICDSGGSGSGSDTHLYHNVSVLIYVFDITTPPSAASQELDWFIQSLQCLKDSDTNSDTPLRLFILINKTDLIAKHDACLVYSRRKAEILHSLQPLFDTGRGTSGIHTECYMTSIWDQSLYKAWSKIVTKLLPSSGKMSSALAHFASTTHAAEVVLFERSTFLVIGKTTLRKDGEEWDLEGGDEWECECECDCDCEQEREQEHHQHHHSHPNQYTHIPTRNLTISRHRFEQISQLIKAFKQSCAKLNNQFNSMQLTEMDYNAVLEPLTINTYILVITENIDIPPSAIQMNIRLAKPYFERVENTYIGSEV